MSTLQPKTPQNTEQRNVLGENILHVRTEQDRTARPPSTSLSIGLFQHGLVMGMGHSHQVSDSELCIYAIYLLLVGVDSAMEVGGLGSIGEPERESAPRRTLL